MVLEAGPFGNTKQSAENERVRKDRLVEAYTPATVWTLENPHWASTGLGCKVLFARLSSMQAGCTAHLCEECRASQDLSFTIEFDPVLT